MSQISPPIRILVIAVLGLVTAYMLLLRPKEETIEPTTPTTPAGNVAQGEPAVSGAGKIAEKAKAAAEAANKKSQATEDAAGAETQATPGVAAKPGTKAPAAGAVTKEGVSLAGLPASVRKPLAKDKVLVMLFWNKDSADDRAVHQELRSVDRWDGEVAVRSASIKDVAKYGRLTRGANVAQSPTTLVVDRDLRVTPLVGYVDARTIDQAAFDAMRNSGGYLKSAYLEKVSEICVSTDASARMVARPTKFAQLDDWASSGSRVTRTLSRKFAGVKAPGKYRGFKRATARDYKFFSTYYADWAAYLGTNPTPSRFAAGIRKFSARETQFAQTARRYDNRMDDQNLVACSQI